MIDSVCVILNLICVSVNVTFLFWILSGKLK